MLRLFGLTSVFVVILALAGTALSKPIMAQPPLSQRLGLADVVVVGRVTGIEDMDVEAVLAPNGAKVKARIAIVTVGEVLRGDKDLKTIKVAFPVPGAVGNPKIRPGFQQQVNLQTGREYLLMLHKHDEGKFFVCPIFADAFLHNDTNPKADTFEKDVAQAKRCLQFLADPEAGLKSKDADDRLLAATLLIQKYRTQIVTGKQEPIAAEESKLILMVLKNAQEWVKFDPVTRASPQMLFLQLGLDQKDGWTPPQFVQGQDYQKAQSDAAHAWLDQNAATYRIKRFVVESK